MNHPLTFAQNLFVWLPQDFTQLPQRAGFDFSPTARRFYTASPYIAYLLKQFADDKAMSALSSVAQRVQGSAAIEPVLPGRAGLYPFQAAGVEYMSTQFAAGRRHMLLADDCGLGKSAQALCLANNLGAKRILIICPASLRENWLRECRMWFAGNAAMALMSGKDCIRNGFSVVVSYNLAAMVKDEKFDLVIVDEIHAIKNSETVRTKLVLGDGKGWRGLVDTTPSLMLSGTPIPNGRPNEIWPVVFRCAPDTISYMKSWAFMQRFCLIEENELTGESIVRGAKRQDELFVRLRGSGFMCRRLKQDVLKDLPPKSYKMVVISPDEALREVLKKEAQFSAEEIIHHGVPVGSALPEVRREGGIAKTPHVIEYVEDLFADGVGKVIVFCHHLEVVGLLMHGLRAYNPAVIVGATAPNVRQKEVDRFQTDPACLVFVGNEAAEEGITLTASSDVVIAEPEWVPGKQDQRADRAHRIGQTQGVVVHIVVVQGSLDAKILGSAAKKAKDSSLILDKGVS